MSDLASNSFEFYDGVRILVTGAILAAIYTAVVETFALNAPLPTNDVLTAVTAVIVSGVVLHFLDIPGKSVIYAAALPHRDLDKWKVSAPGKRSMQNVYFVLMDTRMPSALRNRAQYYGSMFRIGFDAILLFAVSATVSVAAAVLCTYPRGAVHADRTRPVMITGCGLLAALALCALVVAYLRTKPKEGQSHRAAFLGALNHQIPWTDRVLLLLVLAGSYVFARWGFDPALIAAGALGSCLWTFRYVRGAVRAESRTEPLSLRERLQARHRRNIDAATATLLLCLTALSIWIPASIRSTAGTHLNSAAAVGWTLALLTSASLMLSKGHEGKLWGSYFTVTTWLELNRERIIADFGLSGASVPQPPKPWWQRLFTSKH